MTSPALPSTVPPPRDPPHTTLQYKRTGVCCDVRTSGYPHFPQRRTLPLLGHTLSLFPYENMDSFSSTLFHCLLPSTSRSALASLFMLPSFLPLSFSISLSLRRMLPSVQRSGYGPNCAHRLLCDNNIISSEPLFFPANSRFGSLRASRIYSGSCPARSATSAHSISARLPAARFFSLGGGTLFESRQFA